MTMKTSQPNLTHHHMLMNASSFSNRSSLRFGLSLLASALFLSGCLSRPALTHQTFALQTPSLTKSLDARGKGVLAIRAVQVCPLFESRSFVYRVGTDQYEADPYAEFLVPPSRALAIPIQGCLRDSGVFQAVAEPGSQLEANTFLEVYVRELYGDFRTSEQSAAVLSMTFVLFDVEPGRPQRLLLHKEYFQRVPLKEKTAAALAAGWNQALAEIMKSAISNVGDIH